MALQVPCFDLAKARKHDDLLAEFVGHAHAAFDSINASLSTAPAPMTEAELNEYLATAE